MRAAAGSKDTIVTFRRFIWKAKKTGNSADTKEAPEMIALNKAVIPAVWYSLVSASVARLWLRKMRYIKRPGFAGDITRKPTCGCNGLLNRHVKRLMPLARIHFRSHAALFSFTDYVIRASTGRLHCAISFARKPQYGEQTAFLRIEGIL